MAGGALEAAHHKQGVNSRSAGSWYLARRLGSILLCYRGGMAMTKVWNIVLWKVWRLDMLGLGVAFSLLLASLFVRLPWVAIAIPRGRGHGCPAGGGACHFSVAAAVSG